MRFAAKEPTHTASMGTMGAACVASAGAGFWKGTAASMTMYPVVPDYEQLLRANPAALRRALT